MSISDRYLKLREIAYEFAFCVDPVDFPRHWAKHADVLQGCRIVFSDERMPSLLPDGLDTRTFGPNPKAHLQNFFVSSGLFLLSPESLSYRSQAMGRFPLRVDYSVALDSNIVGDIHKFMSGKSLDSRWPAFLEMATFLRRQRINLDATPYLFENFEKARASRKHMDFLTNGFAAFYRFTTGSLLREEPETLADFRFEMNEPDAMRYAERTVAEMLNDPRLHEDGTRRLWHRLDSYYTVLLTAIEYYGCQYASLDQKLNWMLNSLEKNVGRIPEREFLFALLAFADPGNNPFFGNQWPMPYNRQQNIVDLVRNMAWDLSFYRTMETWATKTDRGDFAVPLFLTFDWKLAGMNQMYACRLMLLDDVGKNLFAYSPLNVRGLLELFGLWSSFQGYFSPDRVAKRMGSRIAYDELAAKCSEAEQELHRIVYSCSYQRPV